MDATKLIEEAGRWAQHVRQSPGNGTAGEDLYLAGLLDKLIAALKASEERARKAENERDEISAGLRSSSNLNFAMRQERDALAAANLAANKRIVELEQETDGLHDALRTCDESRKELIDGLKTARDTLDLGKRLIQALEQERDAARGQAQENAEHALDIARDRDAARAELARLTTLRPIAEAPRDGTNILGVWLTSSAPEVMHWDGSYWTDEGEELVYKPTHYLPLPEVKP